MDTTKLDYTEMRGPMTGDVAEGYRDGGLVIVSVRLQGCAEELFALRTDRPVAQVLREELDQRLPAPDQDKAKINAANIRADYETFKTARRDGWEPRPIRTWGQHTYIVLSDIDLAAGPQTIRAIDITNEPGVARFGLAWPEQGWNEESCQALRKNAMINYPDEGSGIGVMVEDGPFPDTVLHSGELIVHVTPGTVLELREREAAIMDEIADSVDGGAPLPYPFR